MILHPSTILHTPEGSDTIINLAPLGGNIQVLGSDGHYHNVHIAETTAVDMRELWLESGHVLILNAETQVRAVGSEPFLIPAMYSNNCKLATQVNHRRPYFNEEPARDAVTEAYYDGASIGRWGRAPDERFDTDTAFTYGYITGWMARYGKYPEINGITFQVPPTLLASEVQTAALKCGMHVQHNIITDTLSVPFGLATEVDIMSEEHYAQFEEQKPNITTPLLLVKSVATAVSEDIAFRLTPKLSDSNYGVVIGPHVIAAF